tara:strand:+ start:11821 stop:12504 length:684 start_codon:yes stop_codon:yes gene_type:complete
MAGSLLRGAGWVLSRAFTTAAKDGTRSLSLWRGLFSTAAATTAIAKREEIGSAVGNAFSHPIDTAEKIGNGVSSAYNGVIDFADGAEEKVEGVINGAKETVNTTRDTFTKANALVNDPMSALTGGASGEDNDEGGFNWWNLAKWGGGIGIGGWLLSKVFGGNDNKDNDSGGGIGFGTILMIGVAALAFFNRDKIMDLVSGNDDDNENHASLGGIGDNYMDPDAFEPG